MVLEPSLCFCFCCCCFFCAVSCVGWDGRTRPDRLLPCEFVRLPAPYTSPSSLCQNWWVGPPKGNKVTTVVFFSLVLFCIFFNYYIDQSREAYTYCSTYNQCHVGLGFKFDPVFTWSREPCYKINSHPLPAVAVLTKKIVTTILFKE